MARKITKNDLSRLMNSEEVAEYLGITEGTLRKWRSAGRGPQYVKLGNDLVRYFPEDVRAYAQQCTVATLEESLAG